MSREPPRYSIVLMGPDGKPVSARLLRVWPDAAANEYQAVRLGKELARDAMANERKAS